MTIINPFSRRDLASLPVNFWLAGQKVSLTQRRGRYVPASVRHPGKMLPSLARLLIDEYTRPGDWILDPLSGIGTTGVEAIHRGRHYVGIELETRWAKLQQANLELARSQGAAGRFEVIHADARRLAPRADPANPANPANPAPLEPGRVDAVLTSPPYGDRLKPVRTPSRPMRRLIAAGTLGRDVLPRPYGRGPANLGNLPDAAYLAGMREIYAGCYSVLKPGGLLVVVIRPGRDRWRLRPLHHETARLCTEAGFTFLDERVAILARVTALPGKEPEIRAHSLFFKRLAIAHLREAGHPVSLEQLEYVLVFRKPGEEPASPRSRSPQDKSGLPTALVGPAAFRAKKEDLAPGLAAPTRLHPTSIRTPPQAGCRP